VNFDGSGFLKFAFVNADGNLTHWSQDGTSVNGSEPEGSVSVQVQGGLYSILLGNTAIDGMGAMDPSLFQQISNLYLRVWFSDGVNGFERISPDRPFASVPYAMSAGSATIENGSIKTDQLNEQILKYLRPEIVVQPVEPVNEYQGATVVLSSVVEGKFVSFQWFKNEVEISGETNDTLKLENLQASLHDGNYTLIASNDFGSVSSNVVPINVVQNLKSDGLLSIGEHASLGSIVGTFNSTNPFGEETIYTLVDGEGDSHNNIFLLEENGTLRSQAYLDFENNASNLSIRVRSDFGNSIFDEKEFIVELQDIDDEITLVPDRSLTIAEHSPRTYLVAQFNATNSLELNATFRLCNGEGSTDNNLFTILQNGELYTTQSLDYETNASSYSVRVRADLGNGLFKEQAYTIELLDLEEQALDQISSIQSYLDQVSQNGVGRVVITSENDLVISESLSLPADLNVTFFSKGDTFVNANIQQSSAQTLSFITGKNLEILSTISSSHQDGQVLIAYGQISSATESVYLNLIRGAVNLMSGYNLHCSTSGGEAVKLFYVITELGTENSRSGTDLQGILLDPDRSYALGADINASATANWNFVEGYTVEGDEAQGYYNAVDFTVPGYYKGFEPLEVNTDFLGLGHVIDGLWVHFSAFGRYDPEPFPSGGLFKSFKNGNLANLTLSNLDVSGGTYTAALVARSENAEIQNCHTSGNVSTKARDHSLFSDFIAPYVGGIVGNAIDTQISFCSNKASISGFYSTGGIAGNLQNSTILSCYNSGNVRIGSDFYYDTHQIAEINSINEPAKGAPEWAAGAYNTDLATQFIGGLAGSMVSSSISHSYNAGDVAWLQAIYGTKDEASSTNGCFWDPDLSSLNTSEGGQAVQPSQEDLGSILSTSGFDFTSSLNSWGPVVGDNWPILNAEKDFRIPEMQIFGDANITHFKDTAWVDPGVEAHDVRDGNLTSDIVVTGTVDVNTTGTYTLTYTVSDAAGNEASITRTVNVGIPANYATDLNSTVSLEMIWVEPGTFTMGSPESESGRSSDETQHEVTLTNGFYLGKYEVTQSQYEAVMAGNVNNLNATPSRFIGYPDRPVEQVSWNDVQVFLNLINDKESSNLPAGWSYSIPTEAEWEYTCRAESSTAFSWGVGPSSTLLNYGGGGGTSDVGSYAPNNWGFYDMHGNVWEWCLDPYSLYDDGPLVDPIGIGSDTTRVYRGGSWNDHSVYVRSSVRGKSSVATRQREIGFRLALKEE